MDSGAITPIDIQRQQNGYRTAADIQGIIYTTVETVENPFAAYAMNKLPGNFIATPN
jgi:hypothetical protein